jgi:hypothetical protein
MIGEESWGMGRINKIYPHTEWRPTRVFWSDNLWQETVADVKEHLSYGYDFYCRPMVIGELTGDYVPRLLGRDGATWQTDTLFRGQHVPSFEEIPPQVTLYDYCTEHSPNRPDPTSWRGDTEEDVYCKFGGTFQVALMHAVEENFNPIFLVGCDLGFTPGGMGETRNHFASDYQVQEYDQKKADGKNCAYKLAHSLARTYAEERGITIYNAGIGGQLEAYERVDFDSLF